VAQQTEEEAHVRHFTLLLQPGTGLVHPIDDALAAVPDCSRESLSHLRSHEAASTLCYWLRGDESHLPGMLDERPDVLAYDVTDDREGTFELYLRVDGGLDTFERCFFDAGLLIDLPVTFMSRGLRLSVIGTSPMVKHAMEHLPDGVACSVERLGATSADRRLLATLTDRQREVIETAFELGYYEIPRRATHADIAVALDLSGSTVDEHLRKTETRLMEQLLS
jgi:DNA-binding CsgD family transcriptional regulator